MTSVSRWWILVVVGIGTMMSSLDTSVVNVIEPMLLQVLHTSQGTIEWVVMIYLLVVSGLLLVFGRLSDLFGQKPIYVVGFFLFTLGSLFCSLASDFMVLVVSRGIQGIGGAMILSASPAILTAAFPVQERGKALGLQGMLTYVGLSLGPPLGAFLAATWGWPAVFLINLPLGVLGFFLALRFIPATAKNPKRGAMDWLGAFLYFVGSTALLLWLSKAAAWGYVNGLPLMSMVVAGIALYAFVYRESRVSQPMLHLDLLRIPLLRGSIIAAFLNYIGMYTILFALPYYGLNVLHWSLGFIGLILVAMPLSMTLVAPFSGRWSDSIGVTKLTVVGMLLLSFGLAILGTLGKTLFWGWVVAPLILAGVGIGLFVSPNSSALLGSVVAEYRGIASGLLAAARTTGMVVGVALGQAVMRAAMFFNHNHYLFGLHAAFSNAAGLALLGAYVSYAKKRHVQPENSKHIPSH